VLFSELTDLSLKHIAGPAAEEFDGVYVGDLLSRAMGHVEAGNLWITIMNNINVIAVASLSEASAVILAEGVALTEDAEEAAREKNISVYSSEKSAFTLCAEIAQRMGGV